MTDHLTYLYELENTMYRPSKNYTETFTVTAGTRTVVVDWMNDVCDKLDIDPNVFLYGVTLFDIYVSLTNPVLADAQGIACMCLFIAGKMLEARSSMISDFVYITDGTYDRDEMTVFLTSIIKKLNGEFIRPSPVFFIPKENKLAKELAEITCYSPKSITLRPSLVANVSVYLVTGVAPSNTEFDYSVCSLMIETLMWVKSKTNFNKKIKGKAVNLLSHISRKCPKVYAKAKQSPPEYIEPPPAFIKGYKKMRSIGKGVGGAVVKIEKDKHYYALKYRDDEEADYILEVACLQRLKGNEWIVRIEDMRVEAKGAFLFFEYGQYNLTKAITKRHVKIDFDNAITWLLGITKAVEWCHYNDIIHADIKPDNIVWFGESFKLIDFGISIPYTSSRKELNWKIITSIFRPPELFLGDERFDYRVDVWSLGTVFYYVATGGEYLFYGNSDEEMLLDIFEKLGTPTAKEWPRLASLPNIRLTSFFPKSKFNAWFFEKDLPDERYRELVLSCLKMNVEHRPTAKHLVECMSSSFTK